jgi:N-acetylglucosaminyl-diphospho-decaprenol L-rhamnosyltransferase
MIINHTKQKSPLITVIILSYNTRDITLMCLDKLRKSIDYLGQSVETVMVENGTDGTGKIIKNKYNWVKLIEPNKNTGFATGQNIGIAAANPNSKYYLLLNSDAYVKPETLRQSVKFMESNKDCHVMGCRLVYADGRLQPSAGFLPRPMTVITWAMGLDLIPGLNRILKPFHPNFKEFFNSSKKVGWVTGAYMFMKNEVIKKTNGFDEKYFMYGEEVEWFKRINDAGFNVWYTPDIEIVHLFAQSSGSTKKAFIKEVEGIYYFINKHYPGNLFWLKPIVKLGMLMRALAFTILGKQYRAEVHFEAAKAG